MKEKVCEIRITLKDRSYPIWIGADLLCDAERWRDCIPGKQVLLVSNTTIAPLYLESIELGLHGLQVESLKLPDGERYKTWESVNRIITRLADQKATRDASIIALGGGVVGDIAGFAAACYMRGIALIQMPTSLLAQVDSSIGGKTGVNLPQGKNLLGAFHQPRAVVIDTNTLATLSEREFRAGLSEVVKYGAINNLDFFAWLEEHADALLAREPTALTQAIATCCQSKADIIMRDERESGERALLNFGHSFGHALETATNYSVLLHGEAVAIGMVQAARLSTKLGLASDADACRLINLLTRLGLPVTRPEVATPARLLELMQLDKKNRNGLLRLILWRGIGKAEIKVIADTNPVIDVLESVDHGNAY